MKKMGIILAGILTVATCLTGCGSSVQTVNAGQTENGGSADGDTIKVVATIFPEYDWVNNVLGEKVSGADVTLLLDNGVDLHSYQPTADDLLKISDCDLLIYVGGESDEWIEDALAQGTNPDRIELNLLEVLGDRVKAEEVVEGMEHEHEHEHNEADEHDHEEADHDEADEHDHDEADHEEAEEHDHEHEEEEMDEHVWLSLKNAQIINTAIAEALAEVDAENADIYRQNASAYNEQIGALDQEYEAVVAAAGKDTVLFGDRFPFRYLTDDYGLNYYAAFVGCSAETEASFETVIFLAGKTDELHLNTILTIEGVEHKIAETIRDNTASKDQQILTLDSMQSMTSGDAAAGKTYLSVMKDNLEVLKEALK